MECVVANRFATCPKDMLIVEDDPLIALDFEDRPLGRLSPCNAAFNRKLII